MALARADKLGQSFTTEVSEVTVPKGGGGCNEPSSADGVWEERVEVAKAIAPGNHVPGLQILRRKAKRVKFDRTAVIGGKTTNINQILNDARGD